jgi:hypothetical protein
MKEVFVDRSHMCSILFDAKHQQYVFEVMVGGFAMHEIHIRISPAEADELKVNEKLRRDWIWSVNHERTKFSDRII